MEATDKLSSLLCSAVDVKQKEKGSLEFSNHMHSSWWKLSILKMEAIGYSETLINIQCHISENNIFILIVTALRISNHTLVLSD
jgi:hypothetical protein